MRQSSHVLLAAVVLLSVPFAYAADNGDPSAVHLKIEAMWVSENADCTDPRLVFEQVPAVYRDMTQNPTFGQANVPNGTYRCLAFRMSDSIKAISAYDSDTGNCRTGVEIVQDIFRNGTSTCPDGSTVVATSGEDTPCVYFSTTGTGNADAYTPQQALPLSGEYAVTADKNATLVTDFRGQVVDTGRVCEVYPPVFGFRE